MSDDVAYNGYYYAMGTTKSGATWYKQKDGLSLYFDPSCDGGEAAPKWVLDDGEPHMSKPNDLDADGTCKYWGSSEATRSSLQYPGEAEWDLYCPKGWKSLRVTIEAVAYEVAQDKAGGFKSRCKDRITDDVPNMGLDA